MGNGLLDNITDIIYLGPDNFNNRQTAEMAVEIDKMNEQMLRENHKYILIGPGRWGSRDRFLGIPVVWPQISNAAVIVEVGLPDFHVDASLGSHFFHNVTSMNVGYFSLNHECNDGRINWEILKNQEVIRKGKYFNHIRFAKPVIVMMDGKKGMAVITLNDKTN